MIKLFLSWIIRLISRRMIIRGGSYGRAIFVFKLQYYYKMSFLVSGNCYKGLDPNYFVGLSKKLFSFF
uniref:Uncharacterized protein n=1 Tax=Anguilla anguilla TaxID=7936 RepID=A0A0E9X5J0_ANGAN